MYFSSIPIYYRRLLVEVEDLQFKTKIMTLVLLARMNQKTIYMEYLKVLLHPQLLARHHHENCSLEQIRLVGYRNLLDNILCPNNI